MKHIALFGLATLLAACGSESPQEQLTQQISRGVQAYTASCAGCHGDMGQGTERGPAVVGMGVFPKEPRLGSVRTDTFTTALDVFIWAQANMPAGAPGTISDEDMLAIFAFDHDANGVKLERPLDAQSAAEIVLNP